MSLSRNTIALALVFFITAGASFVAGASSPQREEFRGKLMSSDFDPNHTISSVVSIVVDRQTTEVEKSSLVAAFNAGGQDAFLQTLRNLPKVGFFRLPDSIAYDLRCVLQRSTPEGGRTLFLATDRPMAFEEQYNQSRSTSYPFTVIELRLGKDGRGDGTIAASARITVSVDGNYFDVENYGPFPIRLTSMRTLK